MIKEAEQRITDYIEMLCIKAIGTPFKCESNEVDKSISEPMIEKYLKRRGYTMNYVLGRKIMVKDFTCVYADGNTIEIWHDIPNSKPFFINNSMLTGLPIGLDYMERI